MEASEAAIRAGTIVNENLNFCPSFEDTCLFLNPSMAVPSFSLASLVDSSQRHVVEPFQG